MKKDAKIIDICCGGRLFWVNKDHPAAVYMDIRQEPLQKLSNGAMFEVKPDIVADFTNIPFPDNTFSMVIFDPPHLKCGHKSFLYKKYGTLNKDWQKSLTKGFSEAFRILKPYGSLIFKWSDSSIPLKDILKLTDVCPLIKHSVLSNSKKSKTHFVVFMKGV